MYIYIERERERFSHKSLIMLIFFYSIII